MREKSNPMAFDAFNGIVAVSLFDGISCNRVALERAGVIIKEYLASELLTINGKPNPSVRITMHNYPDTIQLGDVRNVDGKSLKDVVNILSAGSPCQSFSSAGKREGFDGKSGLFWEFVRLRDEIQPQYFILENVMMKKEWRRQITRVLGVEEIYINSEVVSGQSRPRLFWTNIPYTEIKDRGILLSDVIPGAHTGVNRHGRLNPEFGIIPGATRWKNIGWEPNPKNKAYCLVTCRTHYINTKGERLWYTPEECEALQTLDKGYTAVPGVTDAQRIDALGNGWTVDVLVEAFFKNLPWASNMKVDPMYLEQIA